MTGDSIECFNCGRPNPPWAQVCRSCGVPLVAAGTSAQPAPLFPTDQSSLLSMGAAIGTIVVAVLVAIFVSNLNPTTPTIGFGGSPSPTELPTPQPSASRAATPEPTPTPVPTPQFLGTLVFGTELDPTTKQVVTPVTTFGPNNYFAHSITLPEAFGVDHINEEVIPIKEDGSEGEPVQTIQDGANPIDPKATTVGFRVTSNVVIREWGTGKFVMRVYRGEEQIAEGTFTLVNG